MKKVIPIQHDVNITEALESLAPAVQELQELAIENVRWPLVRQGKTITALPTSQQPLLFGVATCDWCTDDNSVEVNPSNSDGEDVCTCETRTVYFLPTADMAPNVCCGDIVAYIKDDRDYYIGVGDCLDVAIGTIAIWSGSENDIPKGWAFCDGSTVGGKTTPDLRGRFIVGAGEFTDERNCTLCYGIGDTGGFVWHDGSCYPNGHDDHCIDSCFSFWETTGLGGTLCVSTTTIYNCYCDGEEVDVVTGVTLCVGSWATCLDICIDGHSTTDNRPPWYALAYIMRVPPA